MQVLNTALFKCSGCKLHSFVSGQPVDSDHLCQEANISLAIQCHLRTNPDIWSLLVWACPGCQTSLTGHPLYPVCPDSMGRGRLLQTTLAWFANILEAQPEPQSLPQHCLASLSLSWCCHRTGSTWQDSCPITTPPQSSPPLLTAPAPRGFRTWSALPVSHQQSVLAPPPGWLPRMELVH